MGAIDFQRQILSEEEFLTLEEASQTKHEFWFGEMVAMAGASPKHASIASQASRALNNRLDDTPCQAANSDIKVLLEQSRNYVYPDVVVWCDETAKWSGPSGIVLLTPHVIIEVLSASTGARDQGIKLESYQQIPTLLDYLILAQDRVWVSHYKRIEGDIWQHQRFNRREQTVKLAFQNFEIGIGEFYRKVDVPEQLMLWAIED